MPSSTSTTAFDLNFYDSALFEITRGVFRKALNTKQASELAVNGLAAALYKTHPDVLLSVSGFFIPSELLDLARLYGTRVVLVHTESPYEDTRQLELARHADLNLLNDPTNIDTFRAVASTYYMPHSYRPQLHKPGPIVPEMVSDFAFVGTGYESRIRFFEAMDLDGLDVLLAGNWEQLAEDSPLRKHVAHDAGDCLDNEQTVQVYRSAKVGLNLYRREAETEELTAGWACGPREIEMAACGLCFLRESRPEGDELFPMLPTFESPEEASKLLRWWLDHPDECEEAATKARAAVADRTFSNNAIGLLRLLE